MRPRVFPAEDAHLRWDAEHHLQASMRPRVFPAEDPENATRRLRAYPCFNEAAGIPRGRLGLFTDSTGALYLLQ